MAIKRSRNNLIKRANKKKTTNRFLKKEVGIIAALIAIIVTLLLALWFLNIKPQAIAVKTSTNLSVEVAKLKDMVVGEMLEKNISDSYEPWILAQIEQESRGLGQDPMQASENKYNSIGRITSPEESIDWGVGVWKNHIELIRSLGLVENPELLLQSYNYGKDYLYWLQKKGYSGYSEANALEYSLERSKGLNQTYRPVNENKEARYGDYLYVQHVKRYLQ